MIDFHFLFNRRIKCPQELTQEATIHVLREMGMEVEGRSVIEILDELQAIYIEAKSRKPTPVANAHFQFHHRIYYGNVGIMEKCLIRVRELKAWLEGKEVEVLG